MSDTRQPGRHRILRQWFARVAVGAVLAANLSCAAAFILQPERYAAGFELSGLQGRLVVQSFGILFLMWNATYPLVLLRPQAHLSLFAIILVQQALGLAGETWIWLGLPPGHAALWNTGLRFIIFDGLGLLWMGAAFVLLLAVKDG